MSLKSIQPLRRRLANEVYEQLIDAITRREIGPDDNLVQEKLAAELQISRTPVREALMRLEQEGVLTVTNRGTFKLYQMSDKEVKELYQARAAVEGQAIRILTSRGLPENIKHLKNTIRKEEDVTSFDVKTYFNANRNIHRRFVELTGNRFLVEMFDMIWGKALAFHLFAAIENADLSKSFGDHMSLLDAIKTGDKTIALDAITAHIEDGYELQLEGLNSTRND